MSGVTSTATTTAATTTVAQPTNGSINPLVPFTVGPLTLPSTLLTAQVK
jgi:hypothetical protein